MNYKREMTVVYTIMHFLVDFTTIFLISNILLGPTVGMVNHGFVIITYNLIAFAGQLPIGMISDVINKNQLIAGIGCGLACISYPIVFLSPWSACVLAALGNGMFHIGAGSDILNMSMPKAGLSGLFVSSGALGVWLAYKFDGFVITWLCPCLMFFAAILFFILEKINKMPAKEVKIRYNRPKTWTLIAISCFMLTIVIRSLLGMIMNFSWKASPIFAFLFIAGVVSGKALGGFLGDRFGYIKTAVISLMIALISFMFSFEVPLAGIISILCFNMTMPLTLTAIASTCNKKYGFAFGLTTFALAIGFIPVIFGANNWFGAPLLLCGVLASMVFLVIGYMLLKNTYRGEEI